MKKQNSLAGLTKIIGIIGSLLAIPVYFLPYVTFTPEQALELSMFDPNIKPDMAVVDIYHNGTGAVVGWTGTILLVANAVMLYWRRQIWLEALCVLFMIAPLFLIGSAGDSLYSVANHGVAYYVNILALIVLSACLVCDYFVWVTNLKMPRRYCVAGVLIVALAIVPLVIFKNVLTMVGFIVLVPIGVLAIISGVIGLLVSKMRNSSDSDEEGDDFTDAKDNEECITDDGDESHSEPKLYKNKKLYLWGSVIALLVVLVGLLINFYPAKKENETYEWRTVGAETTDIFKTVDGSLGNESLITVPRGTHVEILRLEPDGIWAFVRYRNRKDATACTGYMALSDLADSELQMENDMDSETEAPAIEEESAVDEYENDWDFTTTDTFDGYINDKYAIEMVLNRLDGNLWGEYRYKKNGNGAWIRLEGSWGEGTQVTLMEYVDDRCTGRFVGWYNDTDITGEWISADGEKRMPFVVELKRSDGQ